MCDEIQLSTNVVISLGFTSNSLLLHNIIALTNFKYDLAQ